MLMKSNTKEQFSSTDSDRQRVFSFVNKNSILHMIHGWIARSRQRRSLADLDDHLLGDIGVSRSAAANECAKPFWR